MYTDYLDNIVRYYREQAGNGSLPQRLIRPTPAGIKQECVAVCRSRFQPRDLRTLMAFFGMVTDRESMIKAIERCDRDRFKPMINFLKGDSNSTDDLNIELLAWLIDFPDRSYKPGEHGGYQSNIQQNEQAQETPAIPKKFINRNKKVFLVSAILLLILAGAFFLLHKDKLPSILAAPQNCMIWIGDHYVACSCEPKQGDSVVVAYDAKRIKDFRRITRPDTITIASENKIWYIRRGGKIEYYTAGGRHPIDANRVLKPLSRYMIEKYKNSPQE